MSGKTNQELEKQMKLVLLGLKETSRKQKEKRYKKYWSEIEIPFTLHERLNNYTKYELDTIRKNLEIKNASSLKKAELIALLQEQIPDSLKQIHLLWDSERFKLLTNAASNGGKIDAPDLEDDQIEYFRDNGLIYTGTFKGKKILAVPDDLIEQIIALKDNIKVRATVNRNTEWIKLTAGLLYYYGTLSTQQMISMIEKYTKETINLRDYFEVIHEANSYRKQTYIDENGFSNIRVFDPKRVKQEHQARKSVSYYPFTKQQLLKAGEPEFVERNKSYLQLVNFLTQNFELDREEADSIVEECVYAARSGEAPSDILKFLSRAIEFDSMETVQAVMDRVVYLMNNTREWILKGYAPAELSAKKKEPLQPLPTSKFNQNDSKKVVKVGRNEPCPCGSGKKYKKCCGK
ncbi:hypothetical protein GMB86_00170 [Terrilactibacillus sp. BCM23-1]|uniref:Zinc chelation protein SecC n=1 Tax=Terrilactibacillus tamarindi TaxID=2599694 RepID=A0A6N8CMP1_9BACI|nr:SEC-C metal-binding domain-containing protein [Terrilactibacillus tamarindi]MTT30427.1 hypothetical protein [Terrilactibacillus tamarindi]